MAVPRSLDLESKAASGVWDSKQDTKDPRAYIVPNEKHKVFTSNMVYSLLKFVEGRVSRCRTLRSGVSRGFATQLEWESPESGAEGRFREE